MSGKRERRAMVACSSLGWAAYIRADPILARPDLDHVIRATDRQRKWLDAHDSWSLMSGDSILYDGHEYLSRRRTELSDWQRCHQT